jgi:hypothetical protein
VFALFRSTSTLQHMTSIDESKVAIVVDGRPSPAPLAVGATTTLSVDTVADIDRRSLSFQWSRKDGRPLQCGADPSSCELAALPEDVATEQMEVQCVVAEAMGIVQLAKAVPVVAALPTLGPEPRPSSSPLLSASAYLSEVRLGGGIVGGVLFAVVMVALVCVAQRRRARRRVVAEKSSGMPVPSCPDLPLDGDNHAELDVVASGLGSASRLAPSLLSQEDLVTPMVCGCFFMVSGGLWALLRSPVFNPSRLFVVACLVAGARRLYELDTNQRFV